MPIVSLVDGGGETVKYREIDGVLCFPFEHLDQETAIKNAHLRKGRDDDILLVGYPKTGTHWFWETLKMLTAGKAESVPDVKQSHMLECTTNEQFDALPSPRIINTHFRFEKLPYDMIKRKCKIVLMHRNPKDIAVSLYNHVYGLHGMYKYSGEWKNFLPMFQNGQVDNNSWFDYELDWERAIRETPDYPIHQVFYEDMKENGYKEVKRLAAFLGQSDDQLCKDIALKCQFENMVQDKAEVNQRSRMSWRDENLSFYRKGEVGDWKNWFTVAQDEHFDSLYKEKMAKSRLQFRFSIS